VDMVNNLKVKFNNDFKQIENSEFAQGTALIAYHGDNRNQSSIAKDVFESAESSLALIPIVGNWIAEKQNFGGHDITIEKVGGELVLKDNTIPYGVVKENHNAEWVEIEEDGVVHEYLKADVVLWAGRYQEPVAKVIEDGVNQSMEINVHDFEIKENNSFNIKQFEYSALCLLGKDEDEYGNKGADDVEPCFESASVTVDKVNMSEDFTAKLDELKFALTSFENSNVETQTEVEVEVTEVNEVSGDEQDFNAEVNVEDETEVTNVETEKFMLNSQKRKLLQDALPKQTNTEEIEYYYWVMDFDNNYVYYEEESYGNGDWNWGTFRCEYTESNDAIVVNVDSKVEIFQTWVTGEERDKLQSEREVEMMELNTKISDLEKEIETYKVEVEDKDKVIEDLNTFKIEVEKEIKSNQVEEIISEFESVLKDSDEFNVIKEKAMDMEIAELEKELYALEGKLKHIKKKKEKKFNLSRVAIDVNDKQDSENETKIVHLYGDASKYFKK